VHAVSMIPHAHVHAVSMVPHAPSVENIVTLSL
jgi:hypothetical protein